MRDIYLLYVKFDEQLFVISIYKLLFYGEFSMECIIAVTSKWARWRLKSSALRLFTQPFIQAQVKENIKAPRHWSLCGEYTETGEFPTQRAINAENISIWWRLMNEYACKFLAAQVTNKSWPLGEYP